MVSHRHLLVNVSWHRYVTLRIVNMSYRMKQNLFVRRLSQALLLLLPLWVGACGMKSDEAKPLSELIRGTWRYVSYTIDPSFDLLSTGAKTNDLMAYYEQLIGPPTTDCFTKTTLTFTADGQLVGDQPAPCTPSTNPIGAKATWAITSSKLVIDNSFLKKEYDVAINGNTLRLSYGLTRDFDNDGKSEPATLALSLTKQ